MPFFDRLSFKSHARWQLISLAVFILATVAGLAWFQYQQTQRVQASAREGNDNTVWEFFAMELHLMRYKSALNHALLHASDVKLQQEASDRYDIFASQVLLIKNSQSGETMRTQQVFGEAVAASEAYLQAADPYLEGGPRNLSLVLMQKLANDAESLQTIVHKLVLAARETQSARSTNNLKAIGQFASYGAMVTGLLLLLTALFGSMTLRQMALAGRRQLELIALHDESSHRATHDPLTNLANRVEFEKYLGRALDLARNHQSLHAVMFVDLDRFKIVNDTCGHSAGDKLLRDVVAVISSCIRGTDTFARLGGDEFGVILSHCDPVKAAQTAEHIRDAVDRFRFDFEGHKFHIGASIGLVVVHAQWKSTEAILQAADAACYVAKNAGRNRVHAFEPDDHGVLAKKGETAWAHRIEVALDHGHFQLFWQKIVPLHTEKFSNQYLRGEVLLRMVDAEGGLISPGQFVPVAERFYLASRMDLWVMRALIAAMHEHAPMMHGVDRLSVNLSGQSVSDPVFQGALLELIDGASVHTEKLCFEVTETAAVTNLADCAKFFEALRSRGAKIALDDFGSGMSSFGYLKTLPADVLKIDGQFMKNLLQDRVDQVSVRSMVALARATGMETIAEWVESAEVETLLRDWGVDYVQGYLHHKPAPLSALLHSKHNPP